MIALFGPAGSGKSVQGQMLAEKNGWTWLSMGQLLRDTKDAEVLRVQNEGGLVPSEISIRVLEERLKSVSDINKVVLDGFPRSMSQAEWLVANIQRLGSKLDLAIVLEVPREESVTRLLKRARVDDTQDAIEERLKIYLGVTIPIIYYMKGQGVAIAKVDGVGTVEEVHNRIVEEMRKCHLI